MAGSRSLRRRCCAVLVLLSLALVPAVGDAQELPPPPDQDPFYAVPHKIAELPNGAVLDSRRITAFAAGVPLPATAWQVKYKTLGTHDQPTATVTTVLVPHAPWTGPGTRPLVSFQSAEDGVGTRCAPSWALRGGALAGVTTSQGDLSLVIPLLQRGWAVVTSDYEGPRSEFASAKMTAHGVLDGIRAALRFGPAEFVRSTPVAMWGYSGGGFATTVAAQLHRSYAPELEFAGIAAGGLPGDIRAVYHAANDSQYGGAIAVLLIGLDRAFPAAHLQRYLNAAGRQAMAASQTDCLADAAARHPNMDFSRHISAIGLKRFLDVQWRNSPLKLRGTPAAPIHVYHAVDDDLVPFPPARDLVQRYCAAGATVDFHAAPAGGHFGEAARGAVGAMSYLADRFAGAPAPTTCPPAGGR